MKKTVRIIFRLSPDVWQYLLLYCCVWSYRIKMRMQQAKQDFTMREMSGIIMRTEKLQVM